jgi:hypothetical protein
LPDTDDVRFGWVRRAKPRRIHRPNALDSSSEAETNPQNVSLVFARPTPSASRRSSFINLSRRHPAVSVRFVRFVYASITRT